MKHTIQKILLFACMGALLICFCGCTSLESLRATHGVLINDTTISYQNQEYKLLTGAYGDLNPLVDDTKTVYVATEDVPLLVVEMVGSPFDISIDGKFLIGSAHNIDDGENIYCRADCFDEMQKRVQAEFVPTGYCYEYLDENYDSKIYQLSLNQTAFINSIITYVAPVPLSKTLLYNGEYLAAMDACSEDLLFRRYAFDILRYNNTYYLCTNEISLQIPASQNAQIEDILTNYNSTWADL